MGVSLRKWNLYSKMFYQFFTSFSKPQYAKFISDEELIAHLINEKKTLIRYGDGEFDIIEGKSIHYQKYDPELGKRLDDILQKYIQNENLMSFIVTMPENFINCSGYRILFSRLRLSSWSHARYLFHNHYDKPVRYGDAFLFCRENEEKYRRLWMKSKLDKIIFVHNNAKYAKEFEEKYQITASFVQIPAQNAYDTIDMTLQKIENEVDIDKNIMVLISAGPCGKVLAYELAEKGIWAIDTGHCWDDPLDKNK